MRDDEEHHSPFATVTPPTSSAEDLSLGRGKKPYKKPTYRYEKVFETRALSCGKVRPTEFMCRFHRHS